MSGGKRGGRGEARGSRDETWEDERGGKTMEENDRQTSYDR